MTIKEAADKWGVTLKIARDRAQIIPGAKKKVIWDIPDNVDLPPITSHKALLLMEFLSVFNEGGKPNFSRTGIKLFEIDRGYTYLTDCGYITGRPGKVTSFGKKLIKRLEAKKKTVIKGGINLAGPYAEVEHEL